MPSTRTSNNQLIKAALGNSRTSRTTRETRTTGRSEHASDFESYGTGLSDSPIKPSTNALQPPSTIAKMKPALEAELSGGVRDIPAPNDTIYSSFKDMTIPEFLDACSLYDSESKKWTAVSEAEQQSSEKHLYMPLKEIIHLIFQKFKRPGNEKRWVKDTHNVRMSHIEGEQYYEEQSSDGGKKAVTLKSSPDLSILGNGLHLSGNRTLPESPTYRHCLCPVEIKPTTFNLATALIQAGIYARQCFIHQPFRRYVPVVVIAGSNLHLHIYDRAGVLRADAINIHQDPVTFVRIILGVSTVGKDLQFSPLDPRVRWKLDDEHPTITVKNKDLKHNVKYKVTGTKFSRKSIRGRGTYCVNAQAEIDGKVVAVLIKDAWRSYKRAAEWGLLDKIKGLDGVGQILAYDEYQCTINAFRQHIMDTYSDDSPLGHRYERVFSRLVLQAYGRSIRYFNSKLQLLEALYDAVVGHKNLWKAGILHRDVSIDNILLGVEGAQLGNRGVLIDFDMAIDVNRTEPDSLFRTGTRAFQSLAVLRSSEWLKRAPPQDHLDDLESYLYVLAWICIKYDDTDMSRSPEFLTFWEDSNASTCGNYKLQFFEDPTVHLTEYFDTPVFRKLLISLALLCHARYTEKSTIIREREKKFPLLSEVHTKSSQGKHHDEFLAIIQVAINEQKSVQEEETRRLVPPDNQDSPTETNVEFVEPVADTSQPQASSSNPTGAKRSNPASHDEDEGGSGSLSKRPKISATRRSARLSEKK